MITNYGKPNLPGTMLLLMTVFWFVVQGCLARDSNNDITGTRWKCQTPHVNYGYPIRATADPDQPPPTPSPLPEEWEPQLTSGQVEEIGFYISLHSLVFFKDSIWMTTGAPTRLARYQRANHELTFYSVQIDSVSEFLPDKLFVSKAGELWGLGNLSASGFDVDPYWTGKFMGFLSKYDPTTDKFLPVIDQNGLLVQNRGEISLDEDGFGNLWIILDNMSIARFNPNTRIADIILDESANYEFSQITIGPDDKVWLSARSTNDNSEKYELVRFDPSTGKLTNYGSPPQHSGNVPFYIYIDKNNRVWVHGGWLEYSKDGVSEWYMLIEQAEFFRFNDARPVDFNMPIYSIIQPIPVLESSDGSIWFQGGGLMRLNPITGDWCLISENSYQIVEDDKQNVWITDDKQLYKMHLNP